MNYLLDTNVVSEMWRGTKAHPAVRAWLARMKEESLFTSILVYGELVRGVIAVRRRDPHATAAYNARLAATKYFFRERTLGLDQSTVERWGDLDGRFGPLPAVDGLLAATAQAHGMMLATRNLADVERTGTPMVNPFDSGANDPAA